MCGPTKLVSRMTRTVPPSIPRVYQACAVPFRKAETEVEFCLITSRRMRLWCFPKGGIRSSQDVHSAALAEAHEEAGVAGRILGDPLGQYNFTKNGKVYDVTAVLMQVDACHDAWDEAHLRERRWVSAGLAQELLSRSVLIDLLSEATSRIAAFYDPAA